MMTLTLNPQKLPASNVSKYLSECWRKLRLALKRKYSKNVSFIAVNEYHKSGIPHKHVLVDTFIHQKWLSVKWERLGGGPIVDIRRIGDLKNAARYVGKYLAKDLFINAPKGSKRVTTSRNIKLTEKRSEGEWRLSDQEIDFHYMLQNHTAENVVTDKHDRMMSFETIDPLDLEWCGVPNDRPEFDPDTVEMPPGFSRDKWEVIAVDWEPLEDLDDD